MAKTAPVFGEAAGADPRGGAEGGAGELTEDDILEIRSLYHPPAVLKRLLEAVYWLLMARRLCGRPPTERVSWKKVQYVVNSPSFPQMLWSYDVAALRRAPLVVRHLRLHYFGPGAPGGALSAPAVRRANDRAGALFHWAAGRLEQALAPEPLDPEPGPPTPPRRSLPGAADPPKCAPTPLGLLPSPFAGSTSAPGLLACRPPPLDIRPALDLFRPPRSSPCGSRGSMESPHGSMAGSPTSPSRRRLPRYPLRPAAGCRSQPVLEPRASLAASLADVACLRTTVIVAGRCRKASLLAARALFLRPHTLVVLLVHGAEDAALARWELRDLEGGGSSRLEVEQFDVDTAEGAAFNAERIMVRFPTIKGLVIDAKGLPQMPYKWATEYDVSWALAGATAVFEALRPFFASGARVLVLSSRCGTNGAMKLSQEQHARLFKHEAADERSLEALAAEFRVDLAEAMDQGRSIPCRSRRGWWLDQGAFGFAVLHALVATWHRRHSRLVVCACACSPAGGLDAAEARSVDAIMAKPPSASKEVAGHLFGNEARDSCWLSENDFGSIE